MIQIKNLHFRYHHKKTVLEKINLEINRGEFVGLIGPNGSGKTTLLKNIAKTLSPQEGEVFIDGQADYPPKELAQKLAVVSENGPINFDFTVLEMVLMGRAPFLRRFQPEGKEDLEVARRALEATDTFQFRDRPITHLSAGERQRVFIARCLTQTPKIILLDEPTNYLDINHKAKIFDLLSALNKEKGVTVLAALHDLNLAARYCERLVLMSQGHIFASGPAKTVLTPKNIQKVYGIKIAVKEDPETGKVIVWC